MAITNKQREERKGYVGASDVATIMGLSPWGNVYDLWLEKSGKLEVKEKTSDAMQDGIMLEPMVVRAASKTLGPIERRGYLLECKHEQLPITAHPDGIVKADHSPVEAKTSGIRGPLHGTWGESGTDQIPDMYVIQATVHLMCAKVDVCHVPAFLGGRGFQLFHVNRNNDLVDIISEKVAAFWNLVQTDTAPEGWPTLEVARFIRRTEGKRLMIAPGPVQLWRELDAQAKELSKKADEAKAQILTLMADAEIGETEGGIVKVSKVKSERIDTKLLREKFADVAKQVTKEAESTRITFKENK